MVYPVRALLGQIRLDTMRGYLVITGSVCDIFCPVTFKPSSKIDLHFKVGLRRGEKVKGGGNKDIVEGSWMTRADRTHQERHGSGK